MTSTQLTNEFGQPIGQPMPAWSPKDKPTHTTITGRYCQIRPLQIEDAEALYAAFSLAPDGRDWTYLFQQPFTSLDQYREFVSSIVASPDPLFHTVIDLHTGQPVGTLSLMRLDPTHGVIEVGNVAFSPALKQTPLSTEAQYLLMKHVFETLGFRRYEWKCDSLNAPSRKTAARLGFQFEGIFRQAVVYKARSRDTAWYSVIDAEWPLLKTAFEAWLQPENFDADGKQCQSLVDIRSHLSS